MPSNPVVPRPSRLRAGLPALLLALVAVALVAPADVSAQNWFVGIQGGVAGDFSEEFDGDGVDGRFFELRGSVETEPGVLFRVRLGKLDLDSPDPAVSPDVTIERVGFDVEYQLDRDYYRAGLFLGGGYYQFDSAESDRVPPWDDGEDHWGFWAGVNGWFRVAPDFSIVPEFTVEQINQGDKRIIGRMSIGVEYRF